MAKGNGKKRKKEGKRASKRIRNNKNKLIALILSIVLSIAVALISGEDLQGALLDAINQVESSMSTVEFDHYGDESSEFYINYGYIEE